MIISSVIHLMNPPSERREGSNNPLRPSSARARQPPCHAFSVSWKLEYTEKKEPSEPALILRNIIHSSWQLYSLITVNIKLESFLTNSNIFDKSGYESLCQVQQLASTPYRKQSRTEPTTSSASSLGSLPVTLPILQVKKK